MSNLFSGESKPPQWPEFMTRPRAAELLGITVKSLDRLIRKGVIKTKSVQHSKQAYYPQIDILAYANQLADEQLEEAKRFKKSLEVKSYSTLRAKARRVHNYKCCVCGIVHGKAEGELPEESTETWLEAVGLNGLDVRNLAFDWDREVNIARDVRIACVKCVPEVAGVEAAKEFVKATEPEIVEPVEEPKPIIEPKPEPTPAEPTNETDMEGKSFMEVWKTVRGNQG
jgi:hypothetical protein